MDFVKPLPQFLAQRYHGWKATTHKENAAWYERLATEGQRPRVMVISCCDSRVHVTAIFGAEQGEFFIHRNIANLIPPFTEDGGLHGTSAAIEYAVTVLKVTHLVVMGHSKCGGIKGCYDMHHGTAPALKEASSFVGRWMDLLTPAVPQLDSSEDEATQLEELEKRAIAISLSNLMTFPFVETAVKALQLQLHGLWHDIGTGGLEGLDPQTQVFSAI